MSPIQMAKLESAMRVVIEFNEAFNHHDTQAMIQLVSEECRVEHFEPAPDGALYQGKEAIARLWQSHFDARPGAHFEIEEIFGLGKRCIMRWKYQWSAQDGKERHVRGVDLFLVQDGLIQEQFSYCKGTSR